MEIITDTNEFFAIAVPNPQERNKEVQMGCHFEEVAEMLDTLAATSTRGKRAITNARDRIHELAEYCKHDLKGVVYVKEELKLDFLDALTDQIVTSVGCAYMHGMNGPGALSEVNASNNSKLVDGKPVFQESGKIGKGPNYFKPDLNPFLGS